MHKIHLWCPNIFGFKGGIQAYSGFFLKALQNLSFIEKIDVFLKHDQGSAAKNLFNTHTQFHCSGGWHKSLRTIAFAQSAITSAVYNKPDLIIATHLNFSPALMLANTLRGIPYWVVAHGTEAWDIKKNVIIKSLHKAQKILAVSDFTRTRMLEKYDLSEEQVVVLPNTYDETRFVIAGKPDSLLEKYKLSAKQKILLTVARFDASEPHKGYDQVINAMPMILKELPDTHYVLVGRGDDLPRIMALITKLNLAGSVTIAENVSDQELPSYYNLCDVFVMPSRGEGFGIVFLESMASGKPCIAGNSDGAREPLQNGKLGVLVDPNSVEEIARAVIGVLTQEQSNKILYEPYNLRSITQERFGLSAFQKKLEALFHAQ